MLSFVPLCRYLNLDPNDPVVELLESADLLVYVAAELIRCIAMSGLDDNIHVYLHRGVCKFERHDQARICLAFGTDRGLLCGVGPEVKKALVAP
jgi:hypothetical protein